MQVKSAVVAGLVAGMAVPVADLILHFQPTPLVKAAELAQERDQQQQEPMAQLQLTQAEQ